MNNINYKMITCFLCTTLLIFTVGCSSSEPYFSSEQSQSDDTYIDESTDNNDVNNDSDSNSENDTLNQDNKVTENKAESYDNYIGNWGYTIQKTVDGTMPSESSWDLTIHSIKGNNIVFDYTAYTSAGSATLGTENKNIESTINNNAVEFTCYSSNLALSDAPKEEITVKFYFKDGSVYVESNGSPVELIKGGKTEVVTE